ncbi:hypothetical protein COU49_00580 [Candidatus Nomurabacteria bacterium CG10_big_fil_rev_8_21_14_0_10_35_16]|uniref:N-acetyltransferase domain-containing protein n=1 Tax=Candidatus Nomurabacteria bacterium CG10_big_fil_rev_8_21_14_0_10_35_16 TaxID=1974731 RepID=A0A2H0TBZ3_9BACT|nr:MAG: hypothetical protein COU49_00580 [Candidatus Nomurabacteria bacterium CG10_big_fil_rev_8_21_14_0_10_35_16]
MNENSFGNKIPNIEIPKVPEKGRQEKLDLKIEVAGPEDWKIVRDLRVEAITGPDARMFGLTKKGTIQESNRSEQEWRDELSGDKTFAVLSWSGSNPVGFGRAILREDGAWRIRNGYVKNEFRGVGIGEQIFKMRLDEIRRRGGKQVITSIRPDNLGSLHIAEKFGFKPISTINVAMSSLQNRLFKKGFTHLYLDLEQDNK